MNDEHLARVQGDEAADAGAGVELEPEIDELDIEESAGLDRKPSARRYRIRIDREHYVVQSALITGQALLVLAKKVPAERFMIFQVFHGGHSIEIALGQTVDLRDPGVEKFRTLSRDQTEG